MANTTALSRTILAEPDSDLQMTYMYAQSDGDRAAIRRRWVPPIDLEDTAINPDVLLSLQDHLPTFIRAWKARSSTQERAVVSQAVADLYRFFDFNCNMEWDPDHYNIRMTVRLIVFSPHSEVI
jgi:hypothetical protein